MESDLIVQKFERMGARLKLSTFDRSRPEIPMDRWREPLSIDVRTDRRGEFFEVRTEENYVVELNVVDLRPRDRHLLLMARSADSPDNEKFLCGHDERHWFVAAVPNARGVANVRTAQEALKPREVLDAQESVRVPYEDRARRRTDAYVRQGEWFFLPSPDVNPPPQQILRHEPLRRGRGKPHWVDCLWRSGGETRYVSAQYPAGLPYDDYRELRESNPAARQWWWETRRADALVYAMGAIRHPDHSKVFLDCWHRVFMNTEWRAPAQAHVVFLD